MAGFWLSSAGTFTASNWNKREVSLQQCCPEWGGSKKQSEDLIVGALLFCPISVFSVGISDSGLLFFQVWSVQWHVGHGQRAWLVP